MNQVKEYFTAVRSISGTEQDTPTAPAADIQATATTASPSNLESKTEPDAGEEHSVKLGSSEYKALSVKYPDLHGMVCQHATQIELCLLAICSEYFPAHQTENSSVNAMHSCSDDCQTIRSIKDHGAWLRDLADGSVNLTAIRVKISVNWNPMYGCEWPTGATNPDIEILLEGFVGIPQLAKLVVVEYEGEDALDIQVGQLEDNDNGSTFLIWWKKEIGWSALEPDELVHDKD